MGSRCCSSRPRCATCSARARLARRRTPASRTAAWILVAAGAVPDGGLELGLVNGAADAKNEAALHVLSYVGTSAAPAWGSASGLRSIATGSGRGSQRVLPKWFASPHQRDGGAQRSRRLPDVPPGGLVNYLLLPFWLIAAAIILAKRQKAVGQAPTKSYADTV